jgi:hypothetical protein
MFGWFSSPSAKHSIPIKPRTARLRLEDLESRDVPSTVTLNVTYLTGKNITLSGQLTGAANNAGQTITIGGKATGSTITNTAGYYTITLEASELGAVTAQAADGQSNTAQVTLTDEAPSITEFDADELGDRVWNFNGRISYFRSMQGLKIEFGGLASLQGKWTQTSSTGTYSLLVLLNGLTSDNGNSSAKCISPWGTESEIQYDWVMQW